MDGGWRSVRAEDLDMRLPPHRADMEPTPVQEQGQGPLQDVGIAGKALSPFWHELLHRGARWRADRVQERITTTCFCGL